MGLGTSALLVYAMIYSFTTRGEGLCYTESDILAKRLGLSVKTVERAVEKLFERGLIKKTRLKDYFGYSATDIENGSDLEASVLKEENKREKSQSSNTSSENKNVPTKKEPPEKAKKPSPYPKQKPKKDAPYKSNTPFTYEKDFPEEELMQRDELPRHIFLDYGRRGYIRMTREQYADLSSLVEPNMLQCYLGRLEEICEKCYNELSRVPRSHYKLLRKWIDEDTYVKGSS